MFGENAVRRSAAPISSAMEWNRFLKISNSTGSGRMWRSVPHARTGNQCGGAWPCFKKKKIQSPVSATETSSRLLRRRATADGQRQNSFIQCKNVLTLHEQCRNILY